MELARNIIDKNGLIFAFLLVGLMMLLSYGLSRYVFRGKIPGVAIAILGALCLAFLGGEKGLGDYPVFAGLAFLGGSMFRDFAVVATAMGADLGATVICLLTAVAAYAPLLVTDRVIPNID